ncbi:MAG: RNA 2',3'-cyclic phosphodiesterase [Candidatus Krumholzibacteria bacterium]|nr:RNA 2',3'-cyclic phosphodiesterase [Candidatus Krumholzibacteria bacterium]
MRLFFAVPISETVRGIVSRSIEAFPIADPPWRWIRPENYHITLKFLGETDEELLERLLEIGRETAAATSPFELSFGRFDTFPSISRPRILLFHAESGAARLAQLAGLLEEKLESLGFERERRRFRTHLTLARVKRPIGREALEALEKVPSLPLEARQEVGRIVLVRSVLSREGAKYEEAGSFGLK